MESRIYTLASICRSIGRPLRFSRISSSTIAAARPLDQDRDIFFKLISHKIQFGSSLSKRAFLAGYVIEIGTYGLSGGYMRFFYNGSPIVEASFAITAASQANPCVLTIPGNNFNIGDWIYVAAVVGMTQLNGRYFQVIGVAGNLVTIGNLSGCCN